MWPKSLLTVARSTPAMTRWEAKVCLRTWSVTLSKPALLHAFLSFSQVCECLICEPVLVVNTHLFLLVNIFSILSETKFIGIFLSPPLGLQFSFTRIQIRLLFQSMSSHSRLRSSPHLMPVLSRTFIILVRPEYRWHSFNSLLISSSDRNLGAFLVIFLIFLISWVGLDWMYLISIAYLKRWCRQVNS